SDEENKNNFPLFFGGWNLDENIQKKSSSGGLFRAFADYIISLKGSVYGAVFDSSNIVKHIRGSNENDIKIMMGSKYSQSYNNVYELINEDLDANKYVIYFGTPCQVAGIKKVFCNNKNISKLFLVDLLCHGVNSPLVFNEYLQYLENKYKSKVKTIEQRNKKLGWGFTQVISFFNNKKYVVDACFDPFFIGFIGTEYYLNKSCYNCEFVGKNRYGDVTIGDFWGVDKSRYNHNGVSLFLINNSKGKYLFDNTKDNLYYFETTFEEAVKNNFSLKKGLILTKSIKQKRNIIFNLIDNKKSNLVFSKILKPKGLYLLKKSFWYMLKYIKNKINS
ncbi:MAG TPA: Coenzyme F420 hydrogenase/dehydrogenase, beta subunit C-terminal domain, partial [Spirochaetota bacterium]|nr:Coenzyme F420 hydrogenase/dehydrogenase, beta subunit C-terminal domain [Spirochaetota bacterium]